MGTRLTKEEKKLCKNMLWDLLRLEGKAAGKSLADEFGVDARVFSRWKKSGEMMNKIVFRQPERYKK